MNQMGISRDKKRRWNKKIVKQMGKRRDKHEDSKTEINGDKKFEWNKKIVKQMGISRDKKRRWNKKTVKQM